MSDFLFGYDFAVKLLKWTEEFRGEGNVAEYTLWQATQDFLDLVNQHGLYVCVLQVTWSEYIRLGGVLYCVGGDGYRILRGFHGTSKYSKIKLELSNNSFHTPEYR